MPRNEYSPRGVFRYKIVLDQGGHEIGIAPTRSEEEKLDERKICAVGIGVLADETRFLVYPLSAKIIVRSHSAPRTITVKQLVSGKNLEI